MKYSRENQKKYLNCLPTSVTSVYGISKVIDQHIMEDRVIWKETLIDMRTIMQNAIDWIETNIDEFPNKPEPDKTETSKPE